MDPIILGIIGLFGALLLTILILLLYTGLFESVVVKTGRPPVASMRVAYKFATGPYKDCGYLFTEVMSLVPKLRSIGVYFDNPKKVEPNNLRYIVGAILGESSSDKEEEELLLSKGFKVASFPAVDHAVTTSFPYVWMLSIYIAVAKVWPALDQYIEERKLCAHPAIEIYTSDRILYMMPLAKQEEFYVEEARQAKREQTQTSHTSQTGSEETQEGDEGVHDTTTNSYSSEGSHSDEGSASESSFEELVLKEGEELEETLQA